MIKKFYYWLSSLIFKKEIIGQASRGFWTDAIRRKVVSLCSIGKGKLLEVGCGSGMFLVYAFEANPLLEIYGADNALNDLKERERAELVRIFGKNRIIQAEATALPFNRSEFDIVVCINTLFIMGDLSVVKNAILEMSRVCKKGGKIIIEFRNSKNPFLYFKYRLAKYYDPWVRNLGYRGFNPKQIHQIMLEADLEIVKEIGIGFLIRSLAPIVIFEAIKK